MVSRETLIARALGMPDSWRAQAHQDGRLGHPAECPQTAGGGGCCADHGCTADARSAHPEPQIASAIAWCAARRSRSDAMVQGPCLSLPVLAHCIA
jgi:hypothetical protein